MNEPPDDSLQFQILHEDASCLVVNKPPGILTHAPPGIDSLEVRLKALLDQRDGPGSYLTLCHRLDRPVSGAILFAKTVRAARKIGQQLERRKVRKIYWCCVSGEVTPSEGTCTDLMWKIHGQARAIIVDESHPGAQSAMLHYKTIGRHSAGAGGNESAPGGSWLEITLETGRTHQIRVQAASRGYAVLGDAHYGSTIPFGTQFEDERLRPIALHARELGFRHPESRADILVTAPVPKAWHSLGLPAEQLTAPPTRIHDPREGHSQPS
jgi:23S rRNA pseudouridine1911/1915/1917 synthase